jgi:hypothetical protein
VAFSDAGFAVSTLDPGLACECDISVNMNIAYMNEWNTAFGMLFQTSKVMFNFPQYVLKANHGDSHTNQNFSSEVSSIADLHKVTHISSQTVLVTIEVGSYGVC